MAVSKVILNGNTLIDVTGNTVASSNLLPGYTATGADGETVSGGITTKAAQTYTPKTASQHITANQYLTGAQTISGSIYLTSANIKSGVTIFGVTGTYTGSGGWTLLASQDFTANTTGTSASSLGTISVGSAARTAGKIICVVVRDKAGPRAGYFLGSDSFFFNYFVANGSTSALTYGARVIHRYTTSDTYAQYVGATTTGYGVYGYSITNAGVVNIYQRYNASYSTTINGTYNVQVYALDYAPNQGNPFDYSFE